jgi:coenzyme F420-reducing hydrogenase beta subunit
MINLKNKADCCGCNACAQVCPKHCIILKKDSEGFLYPEVEEALCINCSLCTQVCPIINVANHILTDDTKTLAAFNTNEEERKNSSSGGLFSIIAKYVLSNKGVVFGARFDNSWKVVHDWFDSLDDLDDFRRSKYVQSEIGGTYQEVLSFLTNERLVLFAGTPCQVAGLKSFLKKEFNTLICIDIICHGVPSPMIWQKYLNNKKSRIKQELNVDLIHIKAVTFRDKVNGWRKFNLSIDYEYVINNIAYTINKTAPIWEDDYMLAFLKDFSIRPSCYNCRFRNGKCKSDITLGDFWGINNYCENELFTGEKGTSLLYVHTEKGDGLLSKIQFQFLKMNFKDSIRSNPAVIRSWSIPWTRKLFFLLINKKGLNESFNKAYALYNFTLPIEKFIHKTYNKINKVWQKLGL